MKGFKVIAMNEAGKDALKSQLQDFAKEPLHARIARKQFFRMLSDEESITMEIRNPAVGAMIQPEDVTAKIRQGFAERGAEENRDYLIEVF